MLLKLFLLSCFSLIIIVISHYLYNLFLNYKQNRNPKTDQIPPVQMVDELTSYLQKELKKKI